MNTRFTLSKWVRFSETNPFAKFIYFTYQPNPVECSPNLKDKTLFPETLHEAVKYFADMDASIKFMAAIRWPDGKVGVS